MEIPETIKNNKSIAPFVLRAKELENAEPIVSYYCKIYVLDQILNNRLHKESPEMEQYTVQLLDETEQFKSSDDEAVQKVLGDKTLSVQVVINLVLKVLNSCFSDLNQYSPSMKYQLIHRIRVCLNFISLFELFKSEDEGIDFSRLIGGKYSSFSEFNDGFVKAQSKVLKYHLSRLLKDQVEVKGDDGDLERELDELVKQEGAVESSADNAEESQQQDDVEIEHIDVAEEPEESEDPQATKQPGEEEEAGAKDVESDVPQDSGSVSPVLPSAPKFIDTLPGVPHISPDDSDDIKLPGAPKFLPDDDLSTINKGSSIHIFQPEDKEKQDNADTPKAVSPKPAAKSAPRPASKAAHAPHQDITKENIDIILNKQESIGKIQKHCKFAISALNYEDLKTAEDELTRGLAMIKQLREAEQ